MKVVANKLFQKAAEEEIIENSKARNIENDTNLTVSGDGTWKKWGFSSLYGVSFLIGSFTGKVLDINVKSSYCKMCEMWEKRKSTAEYEKWLEDHESECLANHEESSRKMEVDGMVEVFKRSEELHGGKKQIDWKSHRQINSLLWIGNLSKL